MVTTPENVDLRFEAPGEEVTLETDRGKLSQILRNLISNALKFTETGSVTVSVSTHNGDAILSVTDTGVGIAHEHFERIFDEFGQVDNPLQSRVKGTGLGLALSRRLAGDSSVARSPWTASSASAQRSRCAFQGSTRKSPEFHKLQTRTIAPDTLADPRGGRRSQDHLHLREVPGDGGLPGRSRAKHR